MKSGVLVFPFQTACPVNPRRMSLATFRRLAPWREHVELLLDLTLKYARVSLCTTILLAVAPQISFCSSLVPFPDGNQLPSDQVRFSSIVGGPLDTRPGGS
jgi:hypothetical protein